MRAVNESTEYILTGFIRPVPIRYCFLIPVYEEIGWRERGSNRPSYFSADVDGQNGRIRKFLSLNFDRRPEWDSTKLPYFLSLRDISRTAYEASSAVRTGDQVIYAIYSPLKGYISGVRDDFLDKLRFYEIEDSGNASKYFLKEIREYISLKFDEVASPIPLRMSLDKADEEQPIHPVFSNLIELLRDDITYGGWEFETARKRAFYVRGFTWFRSHVLRNVTDLKIYEDKAKEILFSKEALVSNTAFDWGTRFSYRQAVEAASSRRKPIQFQKAVETLTLCEAAAEDMHRRRNGPPPFEIYHKMRIEAAVSYIDGISESIWADMLNSNFDFVYELREKTQQTSLNVFFQMFNERRTVTHKLAMRTWEVLEQYFPGSIGSVKYLYDKSRTYNPAAAENIDAGI